jgi:hypothetical protein
MHAPGASAQLKVAKLRWLGPGRGFTPSPDTTVSVEVADSWLVDQGRCRGLDLHRRRFTRSCPHPEEAAHFFDDATALLPRSGRWFPRIELDHGEYRLWLRLAPPPSSSVTLWAPSTPDPRRRPTIKGPDLETLADLRAQAVSAGASEALLLSPDGFVREGAYSALMWWRGDVLCTAPDGSGVLPSVTRALVLRLAARRGQSVRFEQVRVGELAGLECWVMSALHGIRWVSGWVLPGQEAGEGARVGEWQSELLGLGVSLDAENSNGRAQPTFGISPPGAK